MYLALMTDETMVVLFLHLGSYTAKVGWANQHDPAMVFRNVITKIRQDKIKKV